MKSVAFILLIFASFSSGKAFGQPMSNSSFVDSLYVDAINSRIDLAVSSGIKYFEINDNTVRIKEKIKNPIFIFKSNEHLINEAILKKETLKIYRTTHKIISQDTVDFNFGIISLTAKRGLFIKKGIYFKKAEFALSCGGTNGYQPDIRYVYDRKSKRWQEFSNIYKLTN